VAPMASALSADARASAAFKSSESLLASTSIITPRTEAVLDRWPGATLTQPAFSRATLLHLRTAEFQEMYRIDVIGDPHQGAGPRLRVVK
jgi:hypothetical protein